MGYPRFGILAALLLGRACARVPRAYMGEHCLWVLAVYLAAEIIEDIIVHREWLPYAPCTKRQEAHYRTLGNHDPRQIYARDSQQGLLSSRALSLHGVRQPSLYETFVIIVPSLFFVTALLELLLGSSYIYGACHVPIKEENRVINGLLWTLPLSCNS